MTVFSSDFEEKKFYWLLANNDWNAYNPFICVGIIIAFQQTRDHLLFECRFICLLLCLKLCCHDIDFFFTVMVFSGSSIGKNFMIWYFQELFFWKIFFPIWYFHGKTEIFWNFTFF
ncbi:unnamed protein product [Blepharisma stoltei]|uniref:Uncharacterized protein n=1 Tax=Blepharisma stoltei TaxID=1481888 RepID=A0AAU9IP48_9CILI|nr:unnamed protein product [Blepharisma stoltei]